MTHVSHAWDTLVSPHQAGLTEAKALAEARQRAAEAAVLGNAASDRAADVLIAAKTNAEGCDYKAVTQLLAELESAVQTATERATAARAADEAAVEAKDSADAAKQADAGEAAAEAAKEAAKEIAKEAAKETAKGARRPADKIGRAHV